MLSQPRNKGLDGARRALDADAVRRAWDRSPSPPLCIAAPQGEMLDQDLAPQHHRDGRDMSEVSAPSLPLHL